MFNSRMIQAVFDDENPETVSRWAYPDMGVWDAERNTDEFCAQLPIYRDHGLLAVTVGLQGGGSSYLPGVYEQYKMTAFNEDGSLKTPYFERLERVLKAADACGVVVIVSYFYNMSLKFLRDRAAFNTAIQSATDWLLGTGYQNVLVEVINEAREETGPHFAPDDIASHHELVKSVTHNGRRLLVGTSAFPDNVMPTDKWLESEDFTIPHGNNHTALELRQKLRDLRAQPAFKKRPRPLLINEDGTDVANLDAALYEGASWGFYHQGYGSDYLYDRFVKWDRYPRENTFGALSGFQTLPVNWGINDPWKEAFFSHLRRVTGGA